MISQICIFNKTYFFYQLMSLTSFLDDKQRKQCQEKVDLIKILKSLKMLC